VADIEIRRAHGMGHEAARAAAERMAEHLGQRFGLKGDWDGDVLSFQGTGVTGTLSLDAKEVWLSVTLGFFLKAMRGSIEQAVNHELEQLFARKPADKADARPKAKAATLKKASPPRKKGG
jgi:putative polyhydroxyalkanoate system protein